MQQLATKLGGARRDRTDDLLRARQALSQLSYGPLTCLFRRLLCRFFARDGRLPICKLPRSLTSLLVLAEKSCVSVLSGLRSLAALPAEKNPASVFFR